MLLLSRASSHWFTQSMLMLQMILHAHKPVFSLLMLINFAFVGNNSRRRILKRKQWCIIQNCLNKYHIPLYQLPTMNQVYRLSPVNWTCGHFSQKPVYIYHVWIKSYISKCEEYYYMYTFSETLLYECCLAPYWQTYSVSIPHTDALQHFIFWMTSCSYIH